MTSLADDKTIPADRHTAAWRIKRFLERHLPDRLYQRSLIIVIAPIVLLQAIMAFIIMERHWDNVTRALSKTVAREVALITDLYDSSPQTAESIDNLINTANKNLDVVFSIERAAVLPPPAAKPFFSLVDSKLTKYLKDRIDRPITVDTIGRTGYIDVRIKLADNLVLRLLANEDRASASSTPIFLSWLLGSSLVLIAVAIFFLRKQISPILELAKAAKSFGMGREVADFRPRGAREVKVAALAFQNMKERIERHVEQRTTMLAGVSHDLRTILTRLKLELALLGRNAKAGAMKNDVDEMQRMLEGYLAFVRGDDGEKSVATNLSSMLREVALGAKRAGRPVDVEVSEDLVVPVKPAAFKRCIGNLVSNAARYGTSVKLSAARADHQFSVIVDDDGPGVPPERREDVFRPFLRLDEARNLDETGTGLGLSIARDIARSHGGDVRLSDSPYGGLRAEILIPV
jgi:two-component system, OmpR family, osmolarity sensor histidine kinase EnvZ